MSAQQLKFGKKPFVASPKDFKFKALWEAQAEVLPDPPSRFGHGLAFPDWNMLGNDEVGDCVQAGMAHQIMLATKLGMGRKHVAQFTTQSVINWYSDLTGYVPGDESTDNGTEPRDMLNAARNEGVPDAEGNRHKIGAFVKLDHTDWDEMMKAIYYCSSIGIGTAIPNTIWEQMDQHMPWDAVDVNAPIDGLHYIPGVGRSGKMSGGVITWGRRVGVTKAFAMEYFDEAWGIFFPEELKAGKNERGLDLTMIIDLLNA